MDKILRAVDVSVWFAHQGWFRPSTCHIGPHILDLHVLQEIDEVTPSGIFVNATMMTNGSIPTKHSFLTKEI